MERAFDIISFHRPVGGLIQDTDQPGRQISGGILWPVDLPTIAPSATGYFRLDSPSFRILKVTYTLAVDDTTILNDLDQRDFHFQIGLWLDDDAGSSIVDDENEEPEFYQIYACADKQGYYIYDAALAPRPNVRGQDRFIKLAEHLIDVPPQWNWNTQLPVPVIDGQPFPPEWKYDDSRWQGQLPWTASLYQPRPGFPGPWTGEEPDPRTPYVQGDGAEMTRHFRWGLETIKVGGPPGLPCDSVLQTETSSTDVSDPDVKYWCHGFGNVPGIYGIQFDLQPPFAPLHGVIPQAPITSWNNASGGYMTIGHHGSELPDIAQQTHRAVTSTQGARCLKTNNATYLNDVEIRIDDIRANQITRVVDLSDVNFREFVKMVPVPGFEPVAVVSYSKRLYWTFWSSAEGVSEAVYIPKITLKTRITFEAIH